MTLRALGDRRELIESLVVRDIRARYAQSVLGIGWAILYPLLMSLIQAAVIVFILRIDTIIPVAVFTYVGNLHWTMFSNGVSGAAESLVGHMNLVAKLRFPRESLPLSAVLGRLADYGFGLLGLVLLIVIFPIGTGISAVLIVPLLAIQLVFTAGLGLIVSALNVFYRDVRHVVGLLLTLWFYLVPVLYSVELVPPSVRGLYLANPMAIIIESTRRAAFPGHGEIEWALVGLAAMTAAATFVVGLLLFRRLEPRFAETV